MSNEQTMNARDQESKRAALVKDIESVVADATQLLKDVTDSSAEEFIVMQVKVETKLDEAKSRLMNMGETAMEKVRSATDKSCSYVCHNPWKVLWMTAAIAAVIGVSLVSRRDH